MMYGNNWHWVTGSQVVKGNPMFHVTIWKEKNAPSKSGTPKTIKNN